MRALLLVFSCVSLLTLGCNDSGPQGAPAKIRACGELDGVEPVERVVIEENPPSLGLEQDCPSFEPVPCTSPIDAYDALCGPGCRPATATNENGDEWLIGCEHSLMTPCPDIDYVPKTECFRDPFNGDEYWYTYPGCSAVLVAIFCWTSCDPDRIWPAPIDWSLYCPAR
ncbi:MAG: hypothetical protein OER77_14500 [Myxococcales bacterium]|nr:hypothetical protein [Myxococcales bacterium]